MNYDLDDILSKQFRSLIKDMQLHGNITLVFHNGYLQRGVLEQTVVENKNGKEIIHNFIAIKEESA